ncbi:MAG TPA: hypothetical protein VHI11_10105 [Jiangellaceae bacterium]|nr:hypothetical protein [Jiangellaceae bacterium]
MSYITDDTTPAPTSGARGVDIVRHRFTEAKDGFKTSEFYVMVAFVAAVLFATYLDADSLGREDGWRFAAFAVVAYIISRGLAKLGVRHPSDDEE